MKVLSLFDGMSVAQQALKEAGIPVEVYYASEIDPYAIAVTQSNHPDTIQLGSVEYVTKETLIVKENTVDFVIDLMIGGSPCQDLSIAKKDRKGLEGSRSGLFWEYVRIRDEVKPKYFILENVASMPKEAKEIISQALGVEPVMINASLVSAQNRKRLFWTCSRSDLCYNCRYEQILKEIQHRGEKTKTQTGSVELLLSEKSEAENKVQDLRQSIFQGGINSEVLLDRVYEYQQEKQRQDSKENGQGERLSKEILSEKEERITRIWKELSEEQQRKVFEVLPKILFQTKSQDEKVSKGCVEKEQQDYQYDWERGIVGYVEKDKHGLFILRFYGGFDSRPYNPSEQGWNKRFRELTTTMSELQFIQEGQVNVCSCCGGIMPVKYEQVEIPQPEDRGILLKDILESDVDEKFYVSEQHRIAMTNTRKSKKLNIPEIDGKTGTLTASYYKIPNDGIYLPIRIGTLNSGGQGDRIYSQDGKSTALSANGGGRGAKTGLYEIEQQIRKLTPTECLRLQSMPDDYFDKAEYKGKPISNTQRYKMCGNAFNKEVIKHILINLTT